MFSATRAGTCDYVLKGAKHDELQRTIRAASNGEAIFSPTVASRMMAFFGSMRPAKLPQMFPELSDREREILERIAQGHKNPEIAEHLVISPKTSAQSCYKHPEQTANGRPR